MKANRALFLSYLATTLSQTLASPAQVVLNDLSQVTFDDYSTTVFAEPAVVEFLSEAKKAILKGKQELQRWFHKGKEYIKQNGMLYELVSVAPLKDHQLRVTEPSLCDPSVKQYSGYLDVADDKHLFFWFFESRNSPQNDPLVLWLNGGPGCSSTTGLLFELGPCRIANEGKNTSHNPYSWNERANVIFLDQPVNVGYSFADNGLQVNTSPVAGKDVYAFLELFLHRFPQYSSQPFHIAAESYGGVYVPNFASVIHGENKKLRFAPNNGLRHINLASIMIGNGLTNPSVQMASVPDYVCDGPYPLYDDPEGPQCQGLRQKASICERFIQTCYRFNSKLTCFPSAVYCNTALFGSLMQTGVNPYDVRRKCDRSKDGDLCYKQMDWIENFMNDPKNKAALGANPDLKFSSCNLEVNKNFMVQGDGMHNSALLLSDLVNDGIRLLIYAGNADMMCNYMGNERWLEQLDSKFQEEFVSTEAVPFVTFQDGKIAGEVRSAGGAGLTAGNVTFVNIYEAGHMVPYDQPEAAYDLFTRWVLDHPLTTTDF